MTGTGRGVGVQKIPKWGDVISEQTKLGPKGSTDAAKGCSPPQELEKIHP